MKQSIKKNIAIEFLFLLGSTVVFFITFFLWTLLVDINHDRISKLKKDITTVYNNNPKFKDVLSEAKDKGASELQLNEIIDHYSSKYIDKNVTEKLVMLKLELKDLKESLFYHDIYDVDLVKLGSIILSITFGLRYLIYATKWSLKQIK